MYRTSLLTVCILFVLGLIFFIWEEFNRPIKYKTTKSYIPYSSREITKFKHDSTVVPFFPSYVTQKNSSWTTLRTIKDIKKGEKIQSDAIKMVSLKRELVKEGTIWTGSQFIGCRVSVDIPKDSILRIGNFKTLPTGFYFMGSDRKQHEYPERDWRSFKLKEDTKK